MNNKFCDWNCGWLNAWTAPTFCTLHGGAGKLGGLIRGYYGKEERDWAYLRHKNCKDTDIILPENCKENKE